MYDGCLSMYCGRQNVYNYVHDIKWNRERWHHAYDPYVVEWLALEHSSNFNLVNLLHTRVMHVSFYGEFSWSHLFMFSMHYDEWRLHTHGFTSIQEMGTPNARYQLWKVSPITTLPFYNNLCTIKFFSWHAKLVYPNSWEWVSLKKLNMDSFKY